MKNYINKRILFKIKSKNLLASVQECLNEGVVEQVTPDNTAVKISGTWYETNTVQVSNVIESLSNESNNIQQLIKG